MSGLIVMAYFPSFWDAKKEGTEDGEAVHSSFVEVDRVPAERTEGRRQVPQSSPARHARFLSPFPSSRSEALEAIAVASGD